MGTTTAASTRIPATTNAILSRYGTTHHTVVVDG
jgi:hypothetical protein